jgi:hypothetical protein
MDGICSTRVDDEIMRTRKSQWGNAQVKEGTMWETYV